MITEDNVLDLFNITGHSPSLIFTLARLLWFKEEETEQYEKNR
jgi:sugar (pentulose or hexulose) kinase